MELILGWIIFGGLVGWLAGFLTKGHGFGLIGNVILGIIGSVVGGWLFSLLRIQTGGTIGNFIVAVIGAIIVIAVARMVARR